MGNILQAKRVYQEARENTAKARQWEGASNKRMGDVLAAEAQAAAVYIYALEEAESIRQNEETYKHRAEGPAF